MNVRPEHNDATRVRQASGGTVARADILPETPRWISYARSYLGTCEIPGPQSNPTILGWAKGLGGWVASWFRDDDTPWCALFAWHVLQACGFPIKDGASLVRAKAFTDYGRALDRPALGCLLVFERLGGGHVGFYTGETATHYRVLGGNQGNRVSEALIAKDRCIAMRWPPGAPDPVMGAVTLTVAEVRAMRVSTDEA